MRIVLEIVAGSQTGRKARLGAGQELRIGRTEWADFSVPEDGQMSGVHFALLTDGVACYVQDLESSNGTFVNGEQITARTVLRDGDEILAGQTKFRIHAEGDAPQRAEPAAVGEITPGIGSAPPLAALSQTPQAPEQVTYSVEKCDSGLTLYRGNVDEISPQELATRLCQVYPVYLIVDFKNLGTPPPEELEAPDYLFDWLDPNVLAIASPVVLSQADLLGWPDLVKQGWGADAVMCLYSKQEKPALLQHLRSMVRTKTHEKDESTGIVGFCWPSVMAPLLSHFEPAFVQRLLEGVEAVLVELPDLPITWQLYGDKQLVDVLDKFGFVQTPPEQNGSQPLAPET